MGLQVRIEDHNIVQTDHHTDLQQVTDDVIDVEIQPNGIASTQSGC